MNTDSMTQEDRERLTDEWSSAVVERDERQAAVEADTGGNTDVLIAALNVAEDELTAIIKRSTTHVWDFSGVFRTCEECGANETYWADDEYAPTGDLCPSHPDWKEDENE